MLKLQYIPKNSFGQNNFVFVGYIQTILANNLFYLIKKSLIVMKQFYRCLALDGVWVV